ncbi:MAG: anti-sigma factor [Acidimicrobiales bacterium]|nr:anti-sigma factor [Acidimicrobiales bacterium]
MARHDNEIAELLGAYALNAVELDEREAVERHLEDCPRCRAEVAEHRWVATQLGNSGSDAPDGLWDRIAATLEEAPPPMRLDLPMPAGVVPLASRRRKGNRVVVGLLAAAASLVIGVLAVEVVAQDDRIEDLQQALGDDAMTSAANLALADPYANRAQLSSADGSLSAAAVVLPDGTGYLVAPGMPALSEDQTYQLWGQTASGLISLGLLGADPNDVVAFQAAEDVQALAVTREQAPGVKESSNPPAMVGSFD